MLGELSQYIESYFGVQGELSDNFSLLFVEETLKKGEFYTKTGDYCLKLSFVRNGFLRIFTEQEKNEVTQWITSSGEFVTDLASFIFETNSRWNIQALVDCELFTIHIENYRKLPEIVPNWEKIEKLFLAKCFIYLEDRVHSFLSMTAEQRYHQLFEHNKEIFNQIPLQYLASMLGMRPETLSRIRNKSIS